MKILFLFIAAFLWHGILTAQDTLKSAERSFDSSSFANDDTLTHSDYLLHFGTSFQTLNKSSLVERFVPSIESIARHIARDDSALIIIRDKLSTSDHSPDIRNLQMFIILLDELSTENKEFNKKINAYDSVLDSTKKEMFIIKEDSAIQQIFKTPSLRETFATQIMQFRTKWKYADSTIKRINILIDETLAHLSNNGIVIDELERQADALVQTTGPRAFSKERRYLWEKRTARARPATYAFSKTLSQEKKITRLYFQHTRNQFYLLLFTGLVFFYWVFYNFKSLRFLKKTSALDALQFNYLKPVPVIVSLIFIFNLAPLFDLNAPPVYIESIEFWLMIALTVLFIKRLSRGQLYMCFAFILLFILLAATRFTGLSFYVQRWWMLCINGASFALGLYEVIILKKQFQKYKVIIFVTFLFIFFHLMAMLSNLFGRVTLTQILGTTAYTAFIQAIGLIVFVQVIKEAFLLQIQSSRIRKNYPAHFEYTDIAKGITRLMLFLAAITWLIGFTTNLNLFDVLNDSLTSFLTTRRTLGSISFTLTGIILFLAIIWTANFLQKYITYFFGDTGDDASFDNKGPRSRLLITRLVLLIAGFLLAVAASGLPLDKITVILGALGIGIGLGLQSIVNNFVSGIILIFDRPLRIGDTVEIGGKKGRVKEISVRSSTLLTPDGAEVIIPNGDILAHNIVNWTLSNSHIRAEVYLTLEQVGLDDKTKQAIKEMIQSVPRVLAQKEAEILLYPVNAQSTKMKVYFWCTDVTNTEQVRSEVYTAVYTYLKGNNIGVSNEPLLPGKKTELH